jgi:hypothetical protein
MCFPSIQSLNFSVTCLQLHMYQKKTLNTLILVTPVHLNRTISPIHRALVCFGQFGEIACTYVEEVATILGLLFQLKLVLSLTKKSSATFWAIFS